MFFFTQIRFCKITQPKVKFRLPAGRWSLWITDAVESIKASRIILKKTDKKRQVKKSYSKLIFLSKTFY